MLCICSQQTCLKLERQGHCQTAVQAKQKAIVQKTVKACVSQMLGICRPAACLGDGVVAPAF